MVIQLLPTPNLFAPFHPPEARRETGKGRKEERKATLTAGTDRHLRQTKTNISRDRRIPTVLDLCINSALPLTQGCRRTDCSESLDKQSTGGRQILAEQNNHQKRSQEKQLHPDP